MSGVALMLTGAADPIETQVEATRLEESAESSAATLNPVPRCPCQGIVVSPAAVSA